MPQSSSKLRVGLLLNGMQVPAWVARMVERIQASHSSEVVLLVVDASTPPPSGQPFLQRLRTDPRTTLQQSWRGVLERLNARLCEAPAQLPDAFAGTDLGRLLGDVPRLNVVPRRTQWSDRLDEADLETIRSHDIDVLVRIGFRILRGGILAAARHGVWSFHHGDNRVNRGGPPGFWEAMQGWHTTGCTLQVLSEDLDNGLVLDRTWSTTIKESVVDNNRSTYWKSLAMMPRQLDALHRKGPERFFADARAAEPHPQIYSQRLFRAADNREYFGMLWRRYLRRLGDRIRARLWLDQWVLMWYRSDGFAGSLWRYHRLVPPKDRFWADPFVIARDGRHHIFFEELMYAPWKGHISVVSIEADGTCSEPQVALAEPHHLSYPFLMEHEGTLYMIPESRSDSCIPLYRCVDFPTRWEKVMNLMDAVQAADATVHFHDGRWWLFVNLIEQDGASSSDELFLFHADTFPTTQWHPHPMNPVVSDVRRARPAGRLFMHGGRLYRPSQDCSERYGGSWNLNVVDELSVTGYAERAISRADPHWAPDVVATHTYNADGGLHVIDAQVRRRR